MPDTLARSQSTVLSEDGPSVDELLDHVETDILRGWPTDGLSSRGPKLRAPVVPELVLRDMGDWGVFRHQRFDPSVGRRSEP